MVLRGTKMKPKYIPLIEAKIKLPTKAFVQRSKQIGPDAWEDYVDEYVVWSIFENTALVTGGGEKINTIHIHNLVVPYKPEADDIEI